VQVTKEQMRLAMELKEALLEVYDPEAVILFGSLGRGDADEFSDVDLLLVIETDRDVEDLGKEVSGYLDPLSKDKHIIVRTPRDFCRQRDIPGTIVFSAARNGKFLFDKKEWRTRHAPADSYDTRKQEVILRDYVQSAYDFLARAESSLQKGNFFRCRDFARFAAVRAIKGLFVQHDIHPPRETDLVQLVNKAGELAPGLVGHIGFIRELNGYRPGKAGTLEDRRSRRMVGRTAAFIRELARDLGDRQQIFPRV
jgi:predicted nucleotidyltransferase